jgi:hypothetical protein
MMRCNVSKFPRYQKSQLGRVLKSLESDPFNNNDWVRVIFRVDRQLRRLANKNPGFRHVKNPRANPDGLIQFRELRGCRFDGSYGELLRVHVIYQRLHKSGIKLSSCPTLLHTVEPFHQSSVLWGLVILQYERPWNSWLRNSPNSENATIPVRMMQLKTAHNCQSQPKNEDMSFHELIRDQSSSKTYGAPLSTVNRKSRDLTNAVNCCHWGPFNLRTTPSVGPALRKNSSNRNWRPPTSTVQSDFFNVIVAICPPPYAAQLN